MSEHTLGAAVAARAAARPDHAALICEGRRVSYAHLHRTSNRTGNALLAAGLRPGARVAYLGKESEHYYDIALGCAKTGVVLVPVNWRLTAGEVDHILRDSLSEVVFVEREFAGVVAEVAASLPALRRVVELDPPGEDRRLERWKGDAAESVPPGAPGPDDAMVQIYTSGTTGLPKGVVLGHRCFFTFPEAMDRHGLHWMEWRPDDVSLIALPAFQIAGFSWAMQGLTAGITNVVMRMFVGQTALDLIERHRVSITFVAPAMLQMLLAEPSATPASFASLRKVAYGGSPISEALLLRCLDAFGAQFLQIYASTETGNVATCLPPADHTPGNPRLASAGRPYPGVEIRVVDRDGRSLPPGAQGEVCVRTPAHMLGYWRLPEATAATLVDGWIHTGDAGHLDADGYLYVGDRIKDMIIVAGQNVYPAEVERAIGQHPRVADVAVVGVPDDRWGEAIHAFVVPRPGERVTPRELLLFLKGQLAGFKVPSRWEFVDGLPRNPAGKVLRRELRDRLWSHLARKVN